MSNDSTYLLVYTTEVPGERFADKHLISKRHGWTKFIDLGLSSTVYVEIPKYSILPETIAELKASQVFERNCGADFWEQIKP